MAYFRQKAWIDYGPPACRTGPPIKAARGYSRPVRIPVPRSRGFGDLHDPNCSWQCGICPWSLCSSCIGPCSCPSNTMWDPTTVSCIPQAVTPASKISQVIVAGEPQANPCNSSTPGATYAGVDANGNAVYLCETSAADNQQRLLQAAMAAAQFAGTPPTAPVDCSVWYNQLLSSSCGGSSTPFLIGGAIVLGLVGLSLFKK